MESPEQPLEIPVQRLDYESVLILVKCKKLIMMTCVDMLLYLLKHSDIYNLYLSSFHEIDITNIFMLTL